MHHVLILGAGRVARPCVRYLQKLDWVRLTVVESVQANLERVTGAHPRTTALNQALPQDLAGFIAAHKPDLVMNLLPAECIGVVAPACLKAGASLVHPVYAGENVQAMEPQLKEAGLTWMFELGVDPGIDHMSAAKTINEIHAAGGRWSRSGPSAAPFLRPRAIPTHGATSCPGRRRASSAPPGAPPSSWRTARWWNGPTASPTSTPSWKRWKAWAGPRCTPTPIPCRT